MAVIKNGFNNVPLNIRFTAHSGTFDAGVEIEQRGLDMGDEKVIQRTDTLSYATLEELVELRDEINKVIAEIVGL